MIRRLPVLHADITAPGDVVRCDIFATDLTAQGCADRSLARLVRPGRKQPQPGERVAPVRSMRPLRVRRRRARGSTSVACRACPRPWCSWTRTAGLCRPRGAYLRGRSPTVRRPSSRRRVGRATARGGSTSTGRRSPPLAALEIAKRERWSYIPQNIGSGRRRATDQAVVVSKPRAA